MKDSALVDCAGYGDSNKDKDYPNVTSVQRIIQNSASVNIWLMIGVGSFDANRGKDFLQTTTAVTRMLNDEGQRILDEILTPIVTKTTKKLKGQMVQHKFQKVLEFLEERERAFLKKRDGKEELTDQEKKILEAFTGPEYPNSAEVSSVLKAIQKMK